MSDRVTFNTNARRLTYDSPTHVWTNNKDSNGRVIEGYGRGDPYKQTSSEYDANAKHARDNMTEERRESLRSAAIQRADILQNQQKQKQGYNWFGFNGGKVAKKTKRKRSRRTKKSRRYRKK
jgi:hypothetical protein